MERISSPQNSAVKLVRSLHLKKHRGETGLFAAEGSTVLSVARRCGWAPQMLMFNESQAPPPSLISWGEATGARLAMTSARVMAELSSQNNPSDVIGVFSQRWFEDDPNRGGGVWVALEDLRDPGNLGTILRTVDAVGANGILLIGASCDPYSREAVRASMGSIFSVPVGRRSKEEFVALARRWSGECVGTALTASEDFRRSYPGRVFLVMGSEGTGLSEEVAHACHTLVRIPMPGQTQSLNVAVATALMLYEIRRPALG